MANFFSKIFFKKPEVKKIEKQKGFIKRFVDGVKSIPDFFMDNVEKVKSTITESKSRLKNLEKSNYDIGKYHLEHGNLWDATFRFKVLNKFWPDYEDSKYYLAYCLALRGKNEDAEKMVNEFLDKNKNHKKAKELLDALKKDKMEILIERYTKEIEKNIKKV